MSSGAIASGQISQFKLASGTVNSGAIASGSVVGSLGGGAFTIASGTIGPNELGSGAVLSGAIASGQVGNFAISSGAITSGRIGTAGTPNGAQFLRDDFTWAATTATIGSGSVGSGAIASGAVEGFFGTTRQIASGSIGVFDFGSGAVVAGTVGSGAIVSGSIASGSIGQFHNASGTVNSGAVASGAVIGSLGGGAFTIASGTIGPNDVGSGGIRSGAIASGQIGTFHISSGTIITYSRNVILDQYNTSETVSGVRCVQFDLTASGAVRVAMAAVLGGFPRSVWPSPTRSRGSRSRSCGSARSLGLPPRSDRGSVSRVVLVGGRSGWAPQGRSSRSPVEVPRLAWVRPIRRMGTACWRDDLERLRAHRSHPERAVFGGSEHHDERAAMAGLKVRPLL